MTERDIILHIAYDEKYGCLVLHNNQNGKTLVNNRFKCKWKWVETIIDDKVLSYLEIDKDDIFNHQEKVGLYDDCDYPEQQEPSIYADIFAFQNIQLDNVRIDNDFHCTDNSDATLVEFNNCILNGITYSQYSPSISVENCVLQGIDLDSDACTISFDESSQVIDELITEKETAFEKAKNSVQNGKVAYLNSEDSIITIDNIEQLNKLTK